MRITKIQFVDAGSAATIVKMACERVEGFSALYTRKTSPYDRPDVWLRIAHRRTGEPQGE